MGVSCFTLLSDNFLWFETDEHFIMSVVIETTQGDVTVDLFLKERPKTCLNFLKLCKTKAYNLNLFHTVQSDFIAQTGDPSGTGRGGESIFCQLYGEQVSAADHS